MGWLKEIWAEILTIGTPWIFEDLCWVMSSEMKAWCPIADVLGGDDRTESENFYVDVEFWVDGFWLELLCAWTLKVFGSDILCGSQPSADAEVGGTSNFPWGCRVLYWRSGFGERRGFVRTMTFACKSSFARLRQVTPSLCRSRMTRKKTMPHYFLTVYLRSRSTDQVKEGLLEV